MEVLFTTSLGVVHVWVLRDREELGGVKWEGWGSEDHFKMPRVLSNLEGVRSAGWDSDPWGSHRPARRLRSQPTI